MNPCLPSPEVVADIRILVVGDVMLELYLHGEVTRISPEAPVPVVHINREESRLGGAANVALNIRALGARVTLLSMVGRDDAASNLRRLVHSKGIDAELREDPEMENIVKLRIIGRSQQMLRLDFEKIPGHEMLASMLDRFITLLDGHDAVLFSDYGKGVLAHISQMIGMARNAGKPVFVDPKGSDWECYKGASVITPNRAVLAQTVGCWSSEDQLLIKVQALRRELDLQALLLNSSEDGMMLFEAGCTSSVPALFREVVDVTGAGDTVIATLALMVACGVGLQQAMVFANRAGGLAVSKFGTGEVTYEELHG